MANPSRWAYAKLAAWAVLDGTVVDVVGFQVDWELNAIPRATVRLPLGRSIADDTPSAIHGLVAGLTEQVPIQVYLEVTSADYSDPSVRGLGVPDGPFLVFDGFTAGGGYSRDNRGQASYTLSCNHWLVQLTQASAFSSSSHPGNPSRFSYGAITRGGGDVGASPGGHWTVLTEANEFVTESNVASDLWGKAFYPWFQALSKKDGFWIRERLEGTLKGDASNKASQAALAKMAPGGDGAVAAKIRSTLKVDVDIAKNIAADVSEMTSRPDFVAHQTLWDILVGNFVPSYMLAVVPTVDRALVVPYVPGNRGDDEGGEAFAKILAQEYVAIQVEAAMRRPLRAFGILSGLATDNGVDMTPLNAPAESLLSLGGWYDVKKEGAVIIQNAPRWLLGVLDPNRGSGFNLNPGGNAMFPGAGTADGTRDGVAGHVKDTIKPLLDAIAQCRYAQEVLQGRYAVVSGALRFDIAPGSLVEIEGASEQFIADLDQFGVGYFGEVLRVSIVVDAEAPAAGTAFHVGYARTAAEHMDDKTSVPGHPLYEKSFRGVGLLPT